MTEENLQTTRQHIAELLEGGFATVIPLLNDFDYSKTDVVLNGLHFSAYSLLLHMDRRQSELLNFIKNPKSNADTWSEAYWPKKFKAENQDEWREAIHKFEEDLSEMIKIVLNPSNDIFEVHKNGKSIFWAACTNFQHNAYHVGQLKSIGRQMGVW